MPRKTLRVEDIVTRLNRTIISAKREERPIVCHIAEAVLMDADAYGGFTYNGGYHPESPDHDEYNRCYQTRGIKPLPGGRA